jgi:hypothetical protein
MSELHISQAIGEHLAHPISALFKTGFKFIFPLFSKELVHAAMWLKLPKG